MKHPFHLSGWKRFRIDLGNEKRNAGDEERLHNDISGRKQKNVLKDDGSLCNSGTDGRTKRRSLNGELEGWVTISELNCIIRDPTDSICTTVMV